MYYKLKKLHFSKIHKTILSNFSIGTEPLTYVNTIKYLGLVFCENKKDDEDMLKQLDN